MDVQGVGSSVEASSDFCRTLIFGVHRVELLVGDEPADLLLFLCEQTGQNNRWT